MDVLIPSRFPVNRSHDFLVYGVGVYWTYWKKINDTDDLTAVDTPLLELYINQERRISLLPIYYDSIILLREPIYIKAEDVLSERLNNNFVYQICKSYGFEITPSNSLQLYYPVKTKPHLVLYGYWKPDTSINKKGYLLTVSVELNNALYELNIKEGDFTLEQISEYQFGYNGKLSEIYFYPNIAQVTKREINIGLALQSILPTINSLSVHKLVRLDYLNRETKLDRIFITQYFYDEAIEYQNTTRLKSIRLDKEITAGDKLIIGINTSISYFEDYSPPSGDLSPYRDIAIFYNDNIAYPFIINFSYNSATL